MSSSSHKAKWHYSPIDGAIYSSDFEHDAGLTLTGDFADDEQKAIYAEKLCALLNAQSGPNRSALLAGVSDLPGLIGALESQKQCDPDGVECQVSRQAVDEALSVLRALSVATSESPSSG